VSSVVGDKCRVRHVQLESVDVIFDELLLNEVRSTWDRTLGPFVPNLPAADVVVDELRERLGTLLRL
jgi:hypothetical protein